MKTKYTMAGWFEYGWRLFYVETEDSFEVVRMPIPYVTTRSD